LLKRQFTRISGFIGEFVIGEERYFTSLNSENIFFQVYTGLVGLEHIEAQEEVNVAALYRVDQDRKSGSIA
jgi:hypothetical protein